MSKYNFHIVGICVDPLNNGQIAYVPLQKLENATGLAESNLLLVSLDGSVNRQNAIASIRAAVKTLDSDLEVFDLTISMTQNQAYLASTWQTIMLLPVFSLVSATLCLVGYIMLSLEDQRKEFGVLRAVGAKPKIIVSVSAIESLIVIASSFGLGLSFGVIITVMILMQNPIITASTIGIISIWIVAVLVAMFMLSLVPTFKLARTKILRFLA